MELTERLKREENLTQINFIVNKGDYQKEKEMYWNYDGGLFSDNTDDEQVRLKAVIR